MVILKALFKVYQVCLVFPESQPSGLGSVMLTLFFPGLEYNVSQNVVKLSTRLKTVLSKHCILPLADLMRKTGVRED